MGFRWALVGLLVVLPWMNSCVLESTDTRPGQPGDPCFDGTECRQGNLCFVTSDDPETGTCTARPEACGDALSCDCIDELTEDCAATFCFGVNYDFTVACDLGGGTRRGLGDSCTGLRPCEEDLMCLIGADDIVGECQEQPDCDPMDCDCLEQVREDECPSESWVCRLTDDSVTVRCL